MNYKYYINGLYSHARPQIYRAHENKFKETVIERYINGLWIRVYAEQSVIKTYPEVSEAEVMLELL